MNNEEEIGSKFLEREGSSWGRGVLWIRLCEPKARLLSYDNGGMPVNQDVRDLEFMLLDKEKVCTW